ncbi:MAG: hypothetical protein ABF289_09515 [Clostridiales bacterium]
MNFIEELKRLDKVPLNEIPIIFWIVLFLLLFIQGTWIFYDASKREANKWIWGIYGLLNVPSSLLVYLIVTRVILKSVKCKNCNKYTYEKYKYCPYCASKIK